MDPEAFAQLLTGWLRERAGTLPQALALDGKMIRDHIGLLTLAQHEDRAPQAIGIYEQKEGTERCEQAAAVATLSKTCPLWMASSSPLIPCIASANWPGRLWKRGETICCRSKWTVTIKIP